MVPSYFCSLVSWSKHGAESTSCRRRWRNWINHLAPGARLGRQAFRGRQSETTALVDATIEDVSLRGEGNGIAVGQWANAVLNNGVGGYQKAMHAAQRATPHPGEIVTPSWASAELVEAAVRSGKESAAEALRRLAELTTSSGTNWARGVEARSRALLSDGDTAERLFLESIDRLGRTRLRVDLAGLTCCMANGSAGSAAESMRAHSFAPPTKCWMRWG